MAVHLASVSTGIHNPMDSYNIYNSSQAQSPFSSASATPSTLSPISPRGVSASTSPKTHCQAPRQLRPPRVPTYVPAVLRPTDHPSRHRPSKSSSSNSVSTVVASAGSSPLTTPPSSNENSFDGKEGQMSMEESLQKRFMASEGITRIVTDEWNDEGLECVTGAPTRDHWKPDSSSPACDSPICSVPFTMLRRRHHCRRCGNIFCWDHSSQSVPLDQHARFHPDGIKARACESCWADFVAWKRRRGERGSASGSEASGVATPIPGSQQAARSRDDISCSSKKAKDAIVGSVPRDWNWSTF